ncbi:MAG: C13 family peptidase [Azoarcus sp.]|jgi:hypothetical protein|nr:C13 family peptidase [Azoarcus sp.]
MTEPETEPRSGLFADLLQLGRLLTLRPVTPDAFAPSLAKLPWLVALYGLLALALSIALNGRDGGALVLDGALFIPFGAMTVVAGLLKWADARLDGGRLLLVFSLLLALLPLAAFLGAEIWPLLAERPFFANPPFAGFFDWALEALPHFIAMLAHIWLAVAGTVYVARAPSRGGWRRGLYLPLTPIALLAVLTCVDPLAIWQVAEPATEAEVEEGLVVDEEVFYRQPELLADALAAVEAGKPGVPEIFFLGLAGSEESVFMREAITVEQLFRDRYATAGHSLLLVNNPATATRLPFASATALTRALRRIGERMNGDEDLLFLFLTSHGLVDNSFSIKMWPFEFTGITPESLRQALDASGVKRRVVVVSACYSGAFVPALADSNTLVIAASAADRSSFGCEAGNELTDFGRAFFAEALNETRSFEDAFARARAIIAEREAADGLTPSLPQIGGGEALRPLLREFTQEAATADKAKEKE